MEHGGLQMNREKQAEELKGARPGGLCHLEQGPQRPVQICLWAAAYTEGCGAEKRGTGCSQGY